MFRNLRIEYEVDNVRVALSTETEDENLPYNLADVFAKVVDDSSANSGLVIEHLKANITSKGGADD